MMCVVSSNQLKVLKVETKVSQSRRILSQDFNVEKLCEFPHCQPALQPSDWSATQSCKSIP